MKTIGRFSLERHDGPYETWPLLTRLLVDGQPSRVRVPGYELLHQFEVPAGYVLVTDTDCPFEEATSFILLDRGLRLLSRRTLIAPYETFWLDRIEWLDDSHFRAVFLGGDCWLVTIRAWGVPFLFPRLRLKHERNPSKGEQSAG